MARRQHDAVAVAVGKVYPVAYATTVGETQVEGLLSDDYQTWMAQELATASSTTSKKKKRTTLKTLLLRSSSGVSHFGPALLEHCILHAKLPPHEPLADPGGEGLSLTDEQWALLRATLQTEGPALLERLKLGTQSGTGGYILYEPREPSSVEEASDLPHGDKLLLEFLPHLFHQYADHPHKIEYDTFGAAVEDFFAQLTGQKRLLKAAAAEQAAKAKLEKIRIDQAERVKALEAEQVLLHKQAKACQASADAVDAALTVINSALNSGMDWDQLEQLVEVEQQKGNPVAALIQQLDLPHDAMILRLPFIDNDAETLDVKISLKDSAHANANALFAKYRASKEKAAKTIEATSAALAAAEESANRQMANQKKTIATVVNKPKPAWYEKFHWFVTSDNYLVLGGRDAHQNEMLVKRYLRPGDAYLHADVHGASSCILRAKRHRSRRRGGRTEGVPLSDQALREAGNFTICRSSAWSSRMVTSAWWVEAHQVTKTAPSGEYLTVGSFMIRGKKNFLPPTQLEMGLGVLFRLGDDASILRHKNDRRDFALMALEAEDEGATDEEAEDETATEPGDEADPSSTNAKNRQPVVKFEEPEAEEGAVESGKHGDARETSDSTPEVVDAGIDDPAEEELASDPTTNGKGKKVKQKRGLSVRDRKLIKKYGSLEEAERVLAGQEKSSTKEVSDSASTATGTSDQNQGSIKRGKKAKMKRVRKKYGDQDAEDKEFAMLALQGGEKSKKKFDKGVETENETQRQVAAETVALLVKDASETAAKLPKTVQSLLAECVRVKKDGVDDDHGEVRWDKFDADTLEQMELLDSEQQQVAAAERLLMLKKKTRIDNFSASLGGIIRTIKKYGHENLNDKLKELPADQVKRKTKEEKQAEATKWKEALAEEGLAQADSDGDEDAVDDTTELNKLTGKPHPDDVILYAVPVCAPYQTLSQYTYRVKLTPGNMKRGKAAKQCVDMFIASDSGKPSPSGQRFTELIKKVTDSEWNQAICSDVKISAPGASKANAKQKANKKKAKTKK